MAKGSILGGLFDEARGVFKDVIDFEKFKLELGLAREANAFEADQDRAQAPVLPRAGLGDLAQSLPFVIGAVVVGFVAVKLLK